MSIGEKIKETYFHWEEKWYGLLDKVDEKIPVYKVVDKVDEVVPSFALLLILALIIVLLLIVSTFGFGVGQQTTLNLMVVDSAGNPVGGAEVRIQGIEEVYYTNDFGLLRDIILPGGYSVLVTAKKGDRSKTDTIWLNKPFVEEQIVLPIQQISFSSRTLQFVNATNSLITDELNLTFSCSTGITPPQPSTRTITSGVVNVEEPSDCGTLTLTITSQKYKTKNISVTQSSRTVTLEESEPARMGRAVVSLKFNDELIEESIRVSAYKASNPYIAEDTVNSVNGTAIFNLPIGDYIFETRSEQGYVSKKSEVVNVNEISDATTTINVEKNIIGKIDVIVKRGNHNINEALITLRKETSAISSENTNEEGQVTFELEQTGPFIIVATKEGYCEQAKTANLGDTIEFNLVTDTGNCGGELKIKVVDSDNRPIQYARAIIFGETQEDQYKLNYSIKTTNYDGNASWSPVKYSENDEKYRVFAYKGSYSGWSQPFTFSSLTQEQVIPIVLELEDGTVQIKVTDRDNAGIQFAEVQLFEDFGNNRVSGKRIIEDTSGIINFNVRAGQRVYAVIEKEGYETYTTMPMQVIGNGRINFEVTLSRPPLEEIFVDFIGLYKNDKRVLQAQPNEEYVAIFEINAPKEYDELGFFIRVGEENVTKTEMDKIYIKELLVPGEHTQLKGASYNPPRGYNIDQDYLNLEESKWASATWDKFGYAVGKIRVGAIVKIKQTARMEDLIEIGYRVWGRDTGYERDPFDSVLGTSSATSQKQALYATTKKAYAWIGTESLCEVVGDNSFCVSATYTDPDGIRTTFDNSFDAQNNTTYNLGIKVTNASNINFINTSTKLENSEENLFIHGFNLITPSNQIINENPNGFQTEWLALGEYRRDTEFSFNGLNITPQRTGYGALLLRLRDTSTILFEKVFGVNIASDKKMTLEYLYDGEYITTIPKIASGKLQTITLRAINVANGLEINQATVKIYDRFNNKIFETTTNSLGIATIEIPASLPSERLRIQVEKPEFETKIVEFRISEGIVNITPENLSFTVNPQTKTEDTKTIKIENKTGFELKIQNIEFSGKTRGLISTTRMDSWFANYVGKTINSNDYDEIDLKVISAPVVPTAGDIEGVFLVTVGNDSYSWVQEVDTRIRVGLGNDVDNANCLEISRSDWVAQTQGEEIEISFEIRNNCTVDGMPVPIRNLGGMVEPSGNVTGKFSAQSTSAYTELSRGFSRTFRPNVFAGEVIPVTVKFTPYGGTSGTTTGTITFEAKNRTDSTDQVLKTSLDYTIDIVNSSCITVGSDLVRVGADGETGSFSITNGCTVETTFQLQTDVEISNTTFNLSPGASQDITITRNQGDIPGAYNLLVNARLGGGRLELIKNVKIIFEIPADSCFTLSRFEYDVFDSPYSEFDGVDRGYLRNNCTQKPVSVGVSGDEGFDWEKVLRDMLVGGVAGYLAHKKWTPWSDKSKRAQRAEESLTKGEENREIAAAEAKKEIQYRTTDVVSQLSRGLENEHGLRTPSDVLSDVKKLQEKFNYEIESQKRMFEVRERTKLWFIPLWSRTTTPEEIERELDSHKDEFEKGVKKLEQAHDDFRNNLAKGFSQIREVNQIQTQFGDMEINSKQTLSIQAIAIAELYKKEVDKFNKKLNDIEKKLDSSIDDNIKFLEEKIDELKSNQSDLSNLDLSNINLDENDLDDKLKNIKENHNKRIAKLNADLQKKETEPNTVRENITAKEGELVNTNSLIDDLTSSKNLNDEQKEILKQHQITSKQLTKEIANLRSRKTMLESQIRTIKDNINSQKTTSSRLVATRINDLNQLAEEKIKQIQRHIAAIDKMVKDDIEDADDESDFINGFIRSETGATTEEINSNNAQSEQITSQSASNNLQNNPTAAFLLAIPHQGMQTAQTTMSPQQSAFGSFGGLGGTIMQMVPSIGAGVMGGSALGGAVLAGLVSIMLGQDNTVAYSETFVVPLIEDITITLENNDGISMSVGEVTYDYDQYYQNLTQQAMGGMNYQTQGPIMGQQTAGNLDGQGLTQRGPQQQGVLFNPQALRATLGLVEVRELEFRNTNQAVNPNPFEPFVGIITVSGREKVYDNDYDYLKVRDAAKARGDFDDKKKNFFLEIFNPTPRRIASMTEEDLTVSELRNYERQFRVLFNSYEYIECGPNTYPCAPPEFASCTVGSKSGVTGPDAAPRLLLNWNWQDIAIDQCDEANPNYTYCDVTQSTISTLKKLSYLKNFFNQNVLTECPSAIDTLGTRSQELNTNTIDVAITNIRFKENNGNYETEIIVRTNNAQELGATINLQIKKDGTVVQNTEQTKRFTSSATYNIPIDSELQTGRYEVVATLDLDLCVGCQNNDTSNDTISSVLLIGASGVQECQSYDTRKDNFEKVLSANNINDPRVLEYINFNINLTRDSFSQDFKNDLDAYLMRFAVAPPAYVDELRELFLSDKFNVKWANEPGAWRAGKYNARLVIEFNNESWRWVDNNDIKSITMHLEYWGDPVPYNPIYNVSFNGTVGLNTDNGRQGYGSNYNQLTEREFVIVEGAQTVRATPNPISNTPTRVNVSVDESFYNMNFTRPGNILTVQRIGDDVELTLSPSLAVPIILDITRNSALDAYAYYSVDVDGQPQTAGSSLFRWNGIGQGCVAHDGSSMTTWRNSADSKSSTGEGYGLRWNNTVASGTSSFYTTFYVPEQKSARLRIMQQSESANFISTHGQGQQIVVSSGTGIRSLSDVFDAVRNEEVCVIGGEYFWNSETVIEPLREEIVSRENTCMTIN